jgi:nucleoside-diphosphate-sugar epimerase
VHAAAVTAVDDERERAQGAEMLEINVVGSAKVMRLAAKWGASRALLVSTAGYPSGSQSRVCREDDPPDLSTLYLISKAAAEQAWLRQAAVEGISGVVVRVGGPYGPMERRTVSRARMSIVFQLAVAALKQHDLVRVAGSDFEFDWTYVDDTAAAIRLLLDAPTVTEQTYNVACGERHTISAVMRGLAECIAGARFEWIADGEGADLDLGRRPARPPLDTHRIRRLGFSSRYSLEDGLRATVPWWATQAEGSA